MCTKPESKPEPIEQVARCIVKTAAGAAVDAVLNTETVAEARKLVAALPEHYVLYCKDRDIYSIEIYLRCISLELYDAYAALFKRRLANPSYLMSRRASSLDTWRGYMPLLSPFRPKLTPRDALIRLRYIAREEAITSQNREYQKDRYQRKLDKTRALQRQALNKSEKFLGKTMCPAGVMWKRMWVKASSCMSWCYGPPGQGYETMILRVKHDKMKYFCAYCCAVGYKHCMYDDVRVRPSAKDRQKWKDTSNAYYIYNLALVDRETRVPDPYDDC